MTTTQDLALALAALPTAALGGALIAQFWFDPLRTKWIYVDVAVWAAGMVGLLALAGANP